MKSTAYILYSFLLSFTLFSCDQNKNVNSKNEREPYLILEAGYSKTDYKGDTLADTFKMFSNNTCTSLEEIRSDAYNSKTKFFQRHCVLKTDTIDFNPRGLDYDESEIAIIRNGYVEFLQGKNYLKLKVLSSQIDQHFDFDTVRFRRYTQFTFDPENPQIFEKSNKSTKLFDEHFEELDIVINQTLNTNPRLNHDLVSNNFFKQCISVNNANSEQIVWVNLLCIEMSSWKYYPIEIMDGGNCNWQFKYNFNTGKMSSIWINGNA